MIQIDVFTDRDTKVCQELSSKAANTSYAPFFSEISHMFSPSKPLDIAEKRLVAKIDNKIVGFIEVNGNHISNIFVDPNSQEHGIGKELLAKVEKENSFDSITLSCFPVNNRAKSLYERFGYVVQYINEINFGGKMYPVWFMKKNCT